MVSHYLVDAVTISGLIFGAFGVFMFSNGLFGKSGNRVLRGAVSVVLYVVFTWALAVISLRFNLTEYYPHDSLQQVLLHPNITSMPAPLFYVSYWAGLAFSAFAFVVIVIAAFRAGSSGNAVFEETSRSEMWLSVGFTLLLLLLIFAISVYLFHANPVEAFLAVAEIAISVVIFRLLFTLFPRIAKMTDRMQQIVGFVLTLIGIATQFLPPVLDLLGVKIG